MQRCDSTATDRAPAAHRRALALGAAAVGLGVLALGSGPVAAQQASFRNFPATALRGEIVVLQPPDVQLNGRPARLAPGARIRAQNNLLMTQDRLANQRFVVHYTLDLQGSLLDVWVLTPAEIERKPWPTTPEQAASWSFDPVAQTWTRP